MHDIRAIRENPDAYDRNWARRGLPPQKDAILKLDEERRAVQTALQTMQQQRNEKSKEIGQIKAQKGDAQALMDEVSRMKDEMAALEEKERGLAKSLEDLLAGLPNLLDDDVPDGTTEDDNKELRRFGEPPRRNHNPDHADIGEKLGMMDFETAAKMSGSRFVLLCDGLARLERALAQFMLDLHTGEHGYTEVSPPLLVRDNAVYGTGQLPKFAEDLFKTTSLDQNAVIKYISDRIDAFDLDNQTSDPSIWKTLFKVSLETEAKELFTNTHWLIPTAEVSLTNMVADQILEGDEFPLRLTAFTPCFRSEAGAAGKDTRGMIRQHQFYKVELVSIVTPDQSRAELERMTACAETVLKKLELPFRTILKCVGDTGFSAQRSYDLEVWLPAQNKYREISSCSNCGDFQARRMGARFKEKGEKKQTQFVHTLNGSGVAVGRALIAILENYHDAADGGVFVPKVLQPYMGGLEKIMPLAKAAGKIRAAS